MFTWRRETRVTGPGSVLRDPFDMLGNDNKNGVVGDKRCVVISLEKHFTFRLVKEGEEF